MTRNAENFQLIHMSPFRGLNQHADEEDVPEGYFVDGENMLCTEKPGVVRTRPGYNHWKVDENGYGVVFPEPIAILPGGGSVDGIITPPAVVPVTPNPSSTIIPIGEEPPLVPTSGPVTPITTPADPTPPPQPPAEPPHPASGGIVLSATPNYGEVDNGTDLTVNFAIQADLPTGVTIATYAWDYIVAGGFSTDTTGSGLTSTHAYGTADFSAYDNLFLAAVKGTGSDGIVYESAAGIAIRDLSEVEQEALLKISLPDLEVIPAGVNFAVQVDHYVQNTTGTYELSAFTGTVFVRQIDGNATLEDEDGTAFTNTPPGASISYSNASTGTDTLQVALESSEPTGTITLQAQKVGTDVVATRTYQVGNAQILVEIVDAAGDALTALDWTGVEDDGGSKEYWTFYLKLTAKNSAGETDEDFNDDVFLTFSFALPGGAYGNQWDNDDLTAISVGIDENAVYSDTTAVTTSESVGEVKVGRDFFTAGDAGQASVKMKVQRPLTAYNYGVESQDANSGISTFTVKAEILQ